ncbi:T9SS type B sorting domain-containing protein, partial [Algibacter sp.]|nr:T9SS type B sorting domain-containing protein [Algibacter sp.]
PGIGCTGDEILNLTITNQPDQPTLACYETATFNASICSWEVIGTQPNQPPIVDCWETFVFNTSSCAWETAVVLPISEESLTFCDKENLTLQPQTNISNPSYIWSTGDISEEITVIIPGVYSVDISGDFCSFETKIFNVIKIESPIIESVISDGKDIIITTSNTGDFMYSLDGNIFQHNNTFYNVKGGVYIVYIKEQNCETTAGVQHLHFSIPKFFTPNNDGIHDTFDLSGIEFFNSSEVSIYDRYGKLLRFSRNGPFSWDGTFNTQNLPADDYWYVIIIEEQKFMGHFTLKR